MSINSGISLLELVVAIIIIGLLLGLGVPAFERMTQSNRLTAEANSLVRAVHLAKNEAAKHYREVVLCPTLDGVACDGISAWTSGWVLFVNEDKDRPPRIDAGESRLLEHRVPSSVEVVANRSSFAFHHFAKRSTNGTVIFCSAQKKSPARAVIVSYTGRPRVDTVRTDGKPYLCEH